MDILDEYPNFCAACKFKTVCKYLDSLTNWLKQERVNWLIHNATSTANNPYSDFVKLLGHWCYYRRTGEFK